MTPEDKGRAAVVFVPLPGVDETQETPFVSAMKRVRFLEKELEETRAELEEARSYGKTWRRKADAVIDLKAKLAEKEKEQDQRDSDWLYLCELKDKIIKSMEAKLASQEESLRRMMEERQDEISEYVRRLITTKLPTCGERTILEFAEEVGAQNALGVLYRQFGWPAGRADEATSAEPKGEEKIVTMDSEAHEAWLLTREEKENE